MPLKPLAQFNLAVESKGTYVKQEKIQKGFPNTNTIVVAKTTSRKYSPRTQ